MLSRAESLLLYLGGWQLTAALSLGSLWVAVNQHPLELKLKRDGNVTANALLYLAMHSCNFKKNLEMVCPDDL